MNRILSFVLMLFAASAFSQSFPSKPVKLVVPTSPGGATDALARSLAGRLSELWSQPVVVENKPGATQIIGGDYVAKSPPDGTTLLVTDPATFIMNPILIKKLPYDGPRAFTPITILVRFPWVIAVHPSVPATNFQEFVAYARSHPGAISYGSLRSSSASTSSTCRTREQAPPSPTSSADRSR
jgi:tripartite-type tricarboxylate transporter receptor subunit TctC